MKLPTFTIQFLSLTLALSGTPIYLIAEEQAGDNQVATEALPPVETGPIKPVEETEPTNNDREPTADIIPEQQASTVAPAEEKPLPPPDGSLRQKKLSGVFEQFIPSEAISADNAVPFPIDI